MAAERTRGTADHPPDLSGLCLAITGHSPLPMAAVEGASHIVCHVNPAFCRLMDLPMEQLVGKPFSEILPEMDPSMPLIDRVFRTGQSESYTEQKHSKHHPVFWSYTMWPLVAEEHPVGVMIQVTETAQFHKQIVAMNESLLLGSLRQHELKAAAENWNAQLQQEIAVRNKAEQELTEKARLLELTNDAIIVHDLDDKITSWNKGAEQLYGWTSEEVIGKNLHSLLHTEFPKPIDEIVKQLHSIGRFSGEFVQTTRDGRRVFSLCRKVLDQETKSILTSYTDITARKRHEEAARAAGERFRFMAESMPQKIFTAKPEGGIDYFNRQWMEFTGLTFEQIRDWGWLQFIHADDLEETARRWKQSIKTGEYFELKHRFRRHDGEYRWHVSRAHALRDDEGKIAMWIGSNTEVDDMMRTQEELVGAQALLSDRARQLEELVDDRTAELMTTNAQLLLEADDRKRLEAEIASAVEGERERLGQELHDGLVQEVTGIGMMMHVLATKLEKKSPALARETRRLCRMLETAHGNARNLAKRFYPVELQHHGLVVALENFARAIQQQSGVSCVVKAGACPDHVKNTTAVHLFRITQEAVHNAVRHAQAKEIRIQLEKGDYGWMLTVKDDGVGLRSNLQNASGMGLRIMQHRARIIQGTLSVCNAQGGGVLVSCAVPVRSPG